MTNYRAKINYSNYDRRVIHTIEAHTSGEYCRIALDCPELEGNTMIERKHFLEEHYDHLRTMLMYEPRGHHDMFGAFVTEPINKEADFGVFFMDGGGYLNMCGHCTIGAVTAVLEGGLMPMTEPITEVVLEAPAGIIRTAAECHNGKVTAVTLTNVPAFLYKRDLELEYEGRQITYDICFGGSFFALVDIDKNFGIRVEQRHIKMLKDLSIHIFREVNATVEIRHPNLDINTLDVIEYYAPTDTPGADAQNVVFFGDYENPQTDRSPCGTGTSAKLANLVGKGELEIGEPFVYESVMGMTFTGRAAERTTVGEFDAIIPQVRGSAYLVGESAWFMDDEDPLTEGFVINQ